MFLSLFCVSTQRPVRDEHRVAAYRRPGRREDPHPAGRLVPPNLPPRPQSTLREGGPAHLPPTLLRLQSSGETGP